MKIEYGPFTDRENEVIHWLMKGMSNKEIAQKLAITESAVEKLLTAIYSKLGVAKRTEAMAKLPRDQPSPTDGTQGSTAVPMAPPSDSQLGKSTGEPGNVPADVERPTMPNGFTPAPTKQLTQWKIRWLPYFLLAALIVGGIIFWRISTPTTWKLSKQFEDPGSKTIGVVIDRSRASGLKVHGQFGTAAGTGFPAAAGYVEYVNLTIPQTDRLYLKIRYSKYTESAVPIEISLDGEPSPRATFVPVDQHGWNSFTWTDPILLGGVGGGFHSIRFSTDGQPFGVADLDEFVLSEDP